MDIETERAQQKAADDADANACPSCRAALVRGMRFCRMCGYRLGEGMAEYVETIRLGDVQAAAAMPNFAADRETLTASGAPTTIMSPPASSQPDKRSTNRGRGKRRNWLKVWLVVALVVFGVVGGKFLIGAVRDAARQRMARLQAPPQPRAFFGAEDFDDHEGGGVLVEAALPDSPADRAGLIDGDVITTFDGVSIQGEDDFRELLRRTAIGKTVEVKYLRDGETRATTLTTIPSNAYDEDAFVPPGGKGLLGVSDLDRVAVEGTKIYGVRLGEVSSNRPADLAGLKGNDIVIEFDGKPVRTVEGLMKRIDFAAPGSIVPVLVVRDGQRITIPVKMGRER
jgi:membrane-associated protease RseP (regulator of RpoE activity)